MDNRIEKIAKNVATKKFIASIWCSEFNKAKIDNITGFGVEVTDALFGVSNTGMQWAAASYNVQYDANGTKETVKLVSKSQAKKFIDEYVSKKKKELDAFANYFVSVLASEAKSAAGKYVSNNDFSDDAKILGITEKKFAKEIIEQAKQLWG